MTFQAQRPQGPPSPTDLAERDRFQRMVRRSLPDARASAEAWRNGLAAFITLVGTAVVVKGRSSTTDLPTAWKAAVTALVGGGLALAVAGLWQALAAQAGAGPEVRSLDDIHRVHGSIDLYEVAMAKRITRRITFARRLVAWALVLLFAGTVLTWWAPGR
ncbi:hypothetical protein [Streptomyces sp. NPDC014006]|uniref:hypothetical protein n=1 Tax=Streptomyces sp. NPDC014006 TaxID=3364870 RepID=UPI0036F968BA